MSNDTRISSATSIDEYLQKNQSKKLVTLPSGTIFEIRKLTGRDFMRQGGFGIQSTKQIVSDSEKRNEDVWNSLTEEEKKKQLEMIDNMIILSVINPQLTSTNEKDKLSIRDLTDKDYNFLMSEILSFSFGNTEDKKFFRQEPSANNT